MSPDLIKKLNNAISQKDLITGLRSVLLLITGLEVKSRKALQEVKQVQKEIIDVQKEVGIDVKKVKLISQMVKRRKELKGDKGEDGTNYTLTKKDKKEIAKSVTVPVVEKVIEKTEVIKELPIITNEVTNEIKEVAVTDTAEDIRNKLELLFGEDRLDVESIKGLSKKIGKLDEKVSNATVRVSGGVTAKSKHTFENKTFDADGPGNTITNIDLSTDVTGNLPATNLNSGTNADATTFWRGDNSWQPATTGFTGDLLDSTSTIIGTVKDGLIQTVVFNLDKILLETGDYILLETGDKILTE